MQNIDPWPTSRTAKILARLVTIHNVPAAFIIAAALEALDEFSRDDVANLISIVTRASATFGEESDRC